MLYIIQNNYTQLCGLKTLNLRFSTLNFTLDQFLTYIKFDTLDDHHSPHSLCALITRKLIKSNVNKR